MAFSPARYHEEITTTFLLNTTKTRHYEKTPPILPHISYLLLHSKAPSSLSHHTNKNPITTSFLNELLLTYLYLFPLKEHVTKNRQQLSNTSPRSCTRTLEKPSLYNSHSLLNFLLLPFSFFIHPPQTLPINYQISKNPSSPIPVMDLYNVPPHYLYHKITRHTPHKIQNVNTKTRNNTYTTKKSYTINIIYPTTYLSHMRTTQTNWQTRPYEDTYTPIPKNSSDTKITTHEQQKSLFLSFLFWTNRHHLTQH